MERVEVKDVRVPAQLMRAMAAEAEAAREARAKVIAAEGEHKASRALRQAAEVIVDSPAALQVLICLYFANIETNCANNQELLQIFCNPFQLRYLQTLNSISAENNSTVIFPVPVDIISTCMSHMTAPTPLMPPLPFPPSVPAQGSLQRSAQTSPPNVKVR